MEYKMDFNEQIKVYGSGTFLTKFPIYSIELKEDVDKTVLEKSVEQAITCHPLFSCKIEKRKNEFVLVTNPQPPIILEIPFTEDFIFGDEHSHFYPWVIFFSGNMISFTASHSFTDGMGAFTFLRTVLYQYLENIGIELGDYSDVVTIHNTTEAQRLKETELTESVYGKATQKSDCEPIKLASLSDHNFIPYGTSQSLSKFILQAKQVEDYAHQHGVTPFAVLAYCLCSAVGEMEMDDQGDIGVIITTNLRKYFGSTTTHNFVQSYLLHFQNDTDAESSQQNLREQLTQKVSQNNLCAQLYEQKMGGEMLKKHPEMAGKILEQATQAVNNHYANVIYSHLTSIMIPDEMLKCIQNVHVWTKPSGANNLVAMGITVGTHMDLTIYERTKDRVFFNNVAKAFQDLGIQYETEEVGDCPKATYVFKEL